MKSNVAERVGLPALLIGQPFVLWTGSGFLVDVYQESAKGFPADYLRVDQSSVLWTESSFLADANQMFVFPAEYLQVDQSSDLSTGSDFQVDGSRMFVFLVEGLQVDQLFDLVEYQSGYVSHFSESFQNLW